MSFDDNPFCPKCDWRIYPAWGEHACGIDMRQTRNVAGDLITQLGFYRIPGETQVHALAEALAFALAANVSPLKAHRVWKGFKSRIEELMRLQLDRQQRNRQSENLVMDIRRPRLTAKKRRTRG